MTYTYALWLAALVGGIGVVCSTIGHAVWSRHRRGNVDVGEAVGYGLSTGLTSAFASLLTSSLQP